MASWSTKLSHPTYVIESCPECSFPEADGGYCPECGWTAYSPDCPHCLKAAAAKSPRRRIQKEIAS